MDFGTFVIAVVTALITAYVAIRNGERNIRIKSITNERSKWRDKIRRYAVQVHRAAVKGDAEKLKELRLIFALNTNPDDKRDVDILSTIDYLREPSDLDKRLLEFSDRVALLLKHDWERAKYESEGLDIRLQEPTRKEYPASPSSMPR